MMYFGQNGRVLGRLLGTAIRLRFFHDSRARPNLSGCSSPTEVAKAKDIIETTHPAQFSLRSGEVATAAKA